MEKRLEQLIKILSKERSFFSMTGKDQLTLLVAFEEIGIDLLKEFKKVEKNG